LRLRFARSKSKRSIPSSIAICAASPAGTLRAERKPDPPAMPWCLVERGSGREDAASVGLSAQLHLPKMGFLVTT